MQLSPYIKDLLYRYECVIIPGFGAFLANYTSATIDADSSTFYPPGKTISFNIQLQTNDGLLANYVASSVLWHKCYGTLRPRGNTKKFKTPDEMIARSKLKDSDYSVDGSDVTFSDRSLRCHKKRTQNKKSIR